MKSSRLAIWLQELRAPFFTASLIPVLVGTALAYYTTHLFNTLLFILAALGTVALHAGANMANDYFDHASRNDWLNKNPTPFSGGSQLIQQGLLSPTSILIAAWLALGQDPFPSSSSGILLREGGGRRGEMAFPLLKVMIRCPSVCEEIAWPGNTAVTRQ